VVVKSLPNLIEDSAPLYGISPRKLWRWALDAILKGVLGPLLPEGQTLDTEFSHGGTGQLTLRKIVRARRRIDRYDPSTETWAKALKFEPGGFDKWLKKVLRDHNFPVIPKRPVGRKLRKRETVRSYISEFYPDSVPDDKTIVREIKAKLGLSVSDRTVRRALGRA
jgi:hypothetical protein